MKLSDIADNAGSRKKRMRIGRGIGSGKGKTGGRGGKGQTARSGVRIKGFEGGQMPLHRRLPKRGFKNTKFARKLNEINLGRIQAAIDAGTLDAAGKIDAAALVKAGMLRRAKGGVRLLGSGEIKAKVTLADAERVRELGASEAAAQDARMAVYQDQDPKILLALAAQELAGALPQIGSVNLSPDLLSSVLGGMLGGPGADRPAPAGRPALPADDGQADPR